MKLLLLTLLLTTSFAWGETVKTIQGTEETVFFHQLLELNLCLKSSETCSMLNLSPEEAKIKLYQSCGCGTPDNSNCAGLEMNEVRNDEGKITWFECRFPG